MASIQLSDRKKKKKKKKPTLVAGSRGAGREALALVQDKSVPGVGRCVVLELGVVRGDDVGREKTRARQPVVGRGEVDLDEGLGGRGLALGRGGQGGGGGGAEEKRGEDGERELHVCDWAVMV